MEVVTWLDPKLTRHSLLHIFYLCVGVIFDYMTSAADTTELLLLVTLHTKKGSVVFYKNIIFRATQFVVSILVHKYTFCLIISNSAQHIEDDTYFHVKLK